MIILIQVQGEPDLTCTVSPSAIAIYEPTNSRLGNLTPLAIWNDVEVNVGILLACFPSMGPLLRILLGQKIDGRVSKSYKSRRLESQESSSARRLKMSAQESSFDLGTHP